MAIWYKASFGEIEEVEIVSNTEKFVTLKSGRKNAISTDWFWYRRSREEVKAAMVSKYEEERNIKEAHLRQAQKKLDDAINA